MRTLFRVEERGTLKESDISRDEVPICVENFDREFVLPKSKNMNKTDIIKDTGRKAEERLIRKNDRMMDLIMQNGGWHMINQITRS